MAKDAYHGGVRFDVVPLIPEVESLLDVGGGVGGTAKHLKAAGLAKRIGVIDAVVPEDDPDLDFAVRLDIENAEAMESLLKREGPYEAVLFLDVLEHLRDPRAVIEQVAGHVAPGGVIVASIPNVRHLSVTWNLLVHNRWEYSEAGILDRTHLRFFVRESAVQLMTLPGYSIEEVTPSPIYSRLDRAMNALTFGLLRSFFSIQYFIRIRRVVDGSVK